MSTSALENLPGRLQFWGRTMLGFPLDMTPFPLPAGDAARSWLGHGLLNNLGDPFAAPRLGTTAFPEERELVRQLGTVLRLDQPWGYLTSCGSEGNARGVLAGLERYPGAAVYASEKVHCSVAKTCRWAGHRLVRVPVDDGDRLDPERVPWADPAGAPAVLCLTAGTVMTGALDDVARCVALFRARSAHTYVHVDAALSGLLLPFVDGAPAFDFRLPIDSLSVSGHKMLGVPIPCGVFLARERPRPTDEYGTSQDATLGGSRSGLAAALMLHALFHYDDDGLARRARHCLDTARYAEGRLRAAGWPCRRVSSWSNMVLLRRPAPGIVGRWQLATEGDWAHVVCMPHVTPDLIDEFVTDLGGSPP